MNQIGLQTVLSSVTSVETLGIDLCTRVMAGSVEKLHLIRMAIGIMLVHLTLLGPVQSILSWILYTLDSHDAVVVGRLAIGYCHRKGYCLELRS